MNVLKLLSSTGFIQYNRYVARVLGVSEAIILGELCSYANMFKFNEFYISQEKLRYKTSLSERQVRQSLRTLEENGVITISKKGNPCRSWYLLHEDTLLELLSKDDSMNDEFDDDVGTSSCEVSELDTAECRNKIQQNVGTRYDKTPQHLKENIKEIENKEIYINSDVTQNTNYYKKLYEKWTSYNLPAPSFISFMQYELKNSIPYLKGNHSDKVFEAIDNYAKVKALGNDTWYTANLTFDSFCKNIQKFMAERFDINSYMTKEAQDKAKQQQEAQHGTIAFYEVCPKCKQKKMYYDNSKNSFVCGCCNVEMSYVEFKSMG